MAWRGLGQGPSKPLRGDALSVWPAGLGAAPSRLAWSPRLSRAQTVERVLHPLAESVNLYDKTPATFPAFVLKTGLPGRRTLRCTLGSPNLAAPSSRTIHPSGSRRGARLPAPPLATPCGGPRKPSVPRLVQLTAAGPAAQVHGFASPGDPKQDWLKTRAQRILGPRRGIGAGVGNQDCGCSKALTATASAIPSSDSATQMTWRHRTPCDLSSCRSTPAPACAPRP
jgi:hypothetical protein